MSKSDTWPGGIALESLSNMDSAGSCDSVISMNSGYSEDSMEHLSAEERACLMYLEETIEALEMQDDSGLSNEEAELGSYTEKMDQNGVNDISSLTSGRDQKSFLSGGVSTPLTHLAAEPASTALTIESETEHHVSEPQSASASATSTKDLKTVDLVTQPNPPATEAAAGCQTHPSHPQMDVVVIPPPSDFMDEPESASQSPEKVKYLPPSAGTSSDKPRAPVDLDQRRQRSSARNTSVSSSVTEEPPSKPPSDVSLCLSPVFASAPQMSPPFDAVEPRSPPAVAPKPKKLPANIILKSHKATAAGSDGNSGHSVATSGDRVFLDPQRVRIEALRKLGLLKSNDEDSSPALSPRLSPKTRRSWAAPSPPVSPAAPQTPPVTPFYTHVSSPPPASVPLQSVSPAAVSPSATAPSTQPPDILPAPAAFSDPVKPLPSDNELSAVKDATEATVNSPPLTPPALVKQLTPPKVIGIKSATLERSGLGLSSEADRGVSHKQSPSQLRNSRPRPASLGSGEEFSSAQGEGLKADRATSKGPDSGRSPPTHAAFQHSKDAQKLPRSQGISVLICPRSDNEEDRREALKKLGLLRD